MNQTFKNWLGGIAAAAALFAAMHISSGPSAAEVQAAQAADLADAQAQAEHVAGLVRKCHLLRGPSAEMLQIRDSDDYVCRVSEIEPVPAEVLHRYASLSAPRQ